MKIRVQSLGVITFTLAFFTLAVQPIAEAGIPPPDGGYAGGNTAELHRKIRLA